MSNARNAMYLLPLSALLEAGMELPVMLGCRAVVAAAVTSGDEEAAQIRRAPHLVPACAAAVLPPWRQ